MIRRNNNEYLMQCRKKAFQIAKKNKWIPYLYMINNIIEKRCNGKPFETTPTGYDGNLLLYGIDYNIVSLSCTNEEILTKWIKDWVESLKLEGITYYETLTTPL
jgi:hypothetical protein